MPYSNLKRSALDSYVTSLRYRLLRTIAIAVLPIALLSIAQNLIRLETARRDARADLAKSAEAIAQKGDDMFQEAMPVLKVLAHQAALQKSGELCDATLSSALIGSSYYINFNRIDQKGTVICSAISSAVGTTVASAPWWRDLEQQRRFLVSAPSHDTIVKEDIFTVALPIFDGDGRFQGAISTIIPLSRISVAFQRKSHSQDGLVALIDSNGIVVMSTDKTAANSIFSSRISKEDVGSVRVIYDKSERSWSYSVSPLSAQDVLIALAVPTRMLIVWSYVDVAINILLPVLVVLVSMLAIWYETDRQILRWITYIGRIARIYARGRYTVRPMQLVGAPAEFEALGKTLAKMAEGIHARDEELQSALRAKSDLIREIHHRVKNHLQIVTSLLRIQTRRARDPGTQRTMEHTISRLNALSLVHRMLQEIEDQSSVNLPQLFGDLSDQVQEGLGADTANIQVELDISEIRIDPDQASPLVLLVVEILTNAYKHAFIDRSSGFIAISLQPTGETNEYLLRIDDNGIGYPEEGVDIEDHGAMGTQLIHAFAKQLGGELSIGPREGGGTSVEFRVKLVPQPPL